MRGQRSARCARRVQPPATVEQATERPSLRLPVVVAAYGRRAGRSCSELVNESVVRPTAAVAHSLPHGQRSPSRSVSASCSRLRETSLCPRLPVLLVSPSVRQAGKEAFPVSLARRHGELGGLAPTPLPALSQVWQRLRSPRAAPAPFQSAHLLRQSGIRRWPSGAGR